MTFQDLSQQMARLLNKIHQHAPYDELYMEALPLFKEISILEDRETNGIINRDIGYDAATEAHIAKAQRKLMKWARNPDSMPSKILDVYGYLSLKEKFIDIALLENTFKTIKEDVTKFRSNFDQMKNFSENNHAKIFDIQPNGNIVVWPPVRQFVENYLDILASRLKK